MQKKTIISSIVFVFLITHVASYSTINPTWITNPYFRAGNAKVINSNTNSGTIRQTTFTYSSPMTGVPGIAYGTKSYRGYDYLNETNFEIRNIGVTSTRFKVEIQLYGTSNLFLLEVQYFAVDPTFPYHINTFDDVSLDYSSALTNITTPSWVPTSFTQQINYTQQAFAKNYQACTNPLSACKIVFFITSLAVSTNSTAPFKMDISYSILTQSSYSWTVTVQQYSTVSKYRFSQIVYDQNNIATSNNFVVINIKWVTNGLFSDREFPQPYEDDMLCGLTGFGAQYGRCGLDYEWDQNNNIAGVNESLQISRSDPTFSSSANCGQNYLRTTLFYIKTWKCNPTYQYFNITSDDCQNACAPYYYYDIIDSVNATCTPCHYSCYNCSQAYTSNTCQQCETGLKRYLYNNTCLCVNGYFDDGFQPACKACAIVDPNSLTCSYAFDPTLNTSIYKAIFDQTTWPVDILLNFTSITCKSIYFVNSSRLCQHCPSYCLTCTSSLTCTSCNSSVPAVLYSNNLCYRCVLNHCNFCYPDDYCVDCASPYVLEDGLCVTCVQACQCNGWVLPKVNGTCSTLCGDGIKVGLQECDDGNTNDHDGCSSSCTLEPCDVSCLCDGWQAPWVVGNNSCTSICGDGLLRGNQECDDGNLVNEDGCSSICRIEPCDVSCLCDGWYVPKVNGMCTTICGDGYKRGYEQCDDGNILDGDGCSSLCIIQQMPLLTAQMSQYPSLVFFLLGFRIVGLEALNVFQNIQLIAESAQVYTFYTSFNIHGFTNPEASPIPVPSKNSLLKNFNFMYIILTGLFIIGCILQIYNVFYRKNNKIFVVNMKQYSPKEDQRSQSQEESHNNDPDNFAVHYKIDEKEKVMELKEVRLDQSHVLKQKYTRKFWGSKFFRQIVFNLLINLLSLVMYSMVDQIKSQSLNSIFNAQTMIILITVVTYLVVMLTLLAVGTHSFGQNRLKFNEGQALKYWFLMVGEKIIFAIFLGTKEFWNLQVLLVIKFLLVIYYWRANIYFEYLQKVRSLVTHFLHFLLIFSVIINEHIFKTFDIQSTFPLLFMEYIYCGWLSLIFLICIVFYIRQIMHYCQADLREDDEPQYADTDIKLETNAVFDVKNFDKMENSAQNFNLSTMIDSKNFDDIKTKRKQRTSAFLDLRDDSEVESAIPNNSASANRVSFATTTQGLQNNISSLKTKKNFPSHNRGHGSDLMKVIEKQEENNIDEVDINQNKPEVSKMQLQALKKFKDHVEKVQHKIKRKKQPRNNKLFTTDIQLGIDDQENQDSEKRQKVFQTQNDLEQRKRNSRQMTFHRPNQPPQNESYFQYNQQIRNDIENKIISNQTQENKNQKTPQNDNQDTVSIQLK